MIWKVCNYHNVAPVSLASRLAISTVPRSISLETIAISKIPMSKSQSTLVPALFRHQDALRGGQEENNPQRRRAESRGRSGFTLDIRFRLQLITFCSHFPSQPDCFSLPAARA